MITDYTTYVKNIERIDAEIIAKEEEIRNQKNLVDVQKIADLLEIDFDKELSKYLKPELIFFYNKEIKCYLLNDNYGVIFSVNGYFNSNAYHIVPVNLISLYKNSWQNWKYHSAATSKTFNPHEEQSVEDFVKKSVEKIKKEYDKRTIEKEKREFKKAVSKYNL